MPQPGSPGHPSGPFRLRGRRGEVQVATAAEVPAALATFFAGEIAVEILDARTGAPVTDDQAEALRGPAASAAGPSRAITIPPPRPRGSSTAEPPVAPRPRSASRPPERRGATNPGLPAPVLIGSAAVVVLLVVIAVLLVSGPLHRGARPADDAHDRLAAAGTGPVRATGTEAASAHGDATIQTARGGMVVVSIGGVAVAPGGATVIGRGVLDVVQPGATPEEVVYTLSLPPEHGYLRRDLAGLGAGATFTQAEVTDDRISYEHGDLAQVRDSFQVTVACPRGGALPALTCALTVTGTGLARGLVAWWPFAEGAGTSTVDASGNGNAGACTTRRGPPVRSVARWNSTATAAQAAATRPRRGPRKRSP